MNNLQLKLYKNSIEKNFPFKKRISIKKNSPSKTNFNKKEF